MKLTPIIEAKKEHYKGKVYDLTVDDTHSYNVNGIAVHNSVCETKTETGVYMPTLESVKEIYDKYVCPGSWNYVEKKGFVKDPEQRQIETLIIADGGIRTPADMCKALAVGADLVMAGSIFAGTTESPGSVLKDKDGRLYKIYRGAASFGVQKEYDDREPAYNEGSESFVPYKGKVEKVIQRFKAGLQSSMSYMNAKNLKEYRENVKVEPLQKE